MPRRIHTLSRRRALRSATLLLTAALLGGCGKANVPERYFQLGPERTWFYAVERTTMDGTTELRHSVTNRPVAAPTHDAVRETAGGGQRRYQRRDDGIFELAGAEAGAAARDVRLLPGVVEPGTRWHSPGTTVTLENSGPPWETLFRIRVPLTMEYHVAATGEAVRTRAGRFRDCLLVVGHGRTNADVGNYIGRTDIEVTSRAWYAPDIGLVRLEREETTSAAAISAGRINMELIAWQ